MLRAHQIELNLAVAAVRASPSPAPLVAAEPITRLHVFAITCLRGNLHEHCLSILGLKSSLHPEWQCAIAASALFCSALLQENRLTSEVDHSSAPPSPETDSHPDPHANFTPEEIERARKRFLLKRFWQSARGYWHRKSDKLAWPFSIGLLVMIGLNVCFQYGINVWNRGLFDAIEQKQASTVYFLAALFPPLVIGSVGLVTIQVWIRMAIQRRWRSWLTTSLVAR